MRLAKRLSSNEDDKTLADVLPAELHQRYLAIKTRYFPRNNELDGQRPLVAGQNLAELVQDEEELGSPRDILRKIDRLAKGQRGVKVINTDYSMRIWVDPQRLIDYEMVPTDIINALKKQNVQAAIGRIGSAPSLPDQAFQLAIQAQGRLTTPEEFGNVVIRATERLLLMSWLILDLVYSLPVDVRTTGGDLRSPVEVIVAWAWREAK